MRTYEHTLEGVVEHKLDPKCRVSVPSDWRVSAGRGILRLLRAEKYGVAVLKVHTEKEFHAVLERIDRQDAWNDRQKQLMRDRFFSDCQKTSMNSQGKLLIPKGLCEKADLEPEGHVSLVGRGHYFELVKPENYETLRSAEEEEVALLDAATGVF